MTTTPSRESTPRTPLRLWPAFVIAGIQVIVMFGAPVLLPDAELPIGMIGGILGAWAIALWWLFFSRARWSERVVAILLMVVLVIVTKRVAHLSMSGAGQGMLIYILPQAYLSLGLVAWAAATRNFHDGARRALLVATILLVCAPFALIRTSGVGGSGSNFHLRWTPTPEEQLLALANDEPTPLPPPATPPETPRDNPGAGNSSGKPAETVGTPNAPAEEKTAPAAAAKTPAEPGKGERELTRVDGPATNERESARVDGPATSERSARRVDWPGFRGPGRDSVVRGVRIETDWSKSPPVALWRRPIGPGWSSFAVQGDFLYTQEQRGEEETVSCYRVSTGEPVWRHRDPGRFYESNGGAGPRGTPTLSQGRVYTLGATGVLNALDAATGTVGWSRNAATDTSRPIPYWGITSSPLVVDDLVVVSVGGTLAAYDLATGQPRWVGPKHGGSYSSPQLVTIDGVRQVLVLSAPGAVSVSPADGTLLWEHTWEGGAIVQPGITADGGILINAMSMTGGTGTRRLAVTRGSSGWTVAERWTSNGLKPFYNDFVVHDGHAYGFDGTILACIDLADGKRKWKGGRYGAGQAVLLADQDLLLVTSEDGELALVSATPDKYTEIARVPAIEGKTWNHPALAGDVLLVRNGEQMAAFRLPLVNRPTESAPGK